MKVKACTNPPRRSGWRRWLVRRPRWHDALRSDDGDACVPDDSPSVAPTITSYDVRVLPEHSRVKPVVIRSNTSIIYRRRYSYYRIVAIKII